jgi:hypothetical protein
MSEKSKHVIRFLVGALIGGIGGFLMSYFNNVPAAYSIGLFSGFIISAMWLI